MQEMFATQYEEIFKFFRREFTKKSTHQNMAEQVVLTNLTCGQHDFSRAKMTKPKQQKNNNQGKHSFVFPLR
jgi:hypothetical protein